MEQQLETAYLRPGLTERAAALGIGAVGIGTGVLLAMWGISLLWRYTPPEIRLANPEITVTQRAPFTVEQTKPLTIEPPPPIRIAPGEVTVRTEPSVPAGATADGKTQTGDVLKRQVTVFWQVAHELGIVVTGWNYSDGRGGVPVSEFCYYSAPNLDGSSKRVDLAKNRISPNISPGLVPELAIALAKCQWSPGGA